MPIVQNDPSENQCVSDSPAAQNGDECQPDVASPQDLPEPNGNLPAGNVPLLRVHIGEQTLNVQPADLTCEGLVEEIQSRCENAAHPPTFEVRDLFVWRDEERYTLLRLLHALQGHALIQLGAGAEACSDIFAAVVNSLTGPDDYQRCIAGRRAAVEAAALFIPADGWIIAANRIRDQLHAVGVRGVLPQSLRKQIADVAGETAEAEGISASVAASGFHAGLRSELGLEGEIPVLRYFQDEIYAWNGHHWSRLQDREFEARVTRYLQNDGRYKVTKKLVTDVVVNLKGQVMLPNWTRSLPLWIESEQPLDIQSRRIIAFENGMIDLDRVAEGEVPRLQPLDRRFFSTVSLPYAYAPAAECPLWLETIGEILPTESDGDRRLDVLQEFMGLTLFSGDTTFEAFLICVGRGANGKSTILRTWEAMLGSDNVTHVPLDALGKDFRLEEMRGKQANIASDMKRLEKWEEGRLKELVSGEPIQVDRKFKPTLTMVPTARLIFATNELPPINDRSDGLWRRMTAMPFHVQFTAERIDRQRGQRLRAELPGIFNWALQGAMRLYRQGRFTACQICDQCVDEHRQHSDPFLQFVDEEVELRPGHSVPTESLYSAYKEFCERNGRKAKGSSEFGKQVLELSGVTRVRQTAGRRKYDYRGVILRTPQPTLNLPGRTRRMNGQVFSTN